MQQTSMERYDCMYTEAPFAHDMHPLPMDLISRQAAANRTQASASLCVHLFLCDM